MLFHHISDRPHMAFPEESILKKLMLSAALALVLPVSAFAQQPLSPQEKGLSAPIISLTPVLAKNADALKLDDAQKAELKAFLDVMPAKRMAFEDETAALRGQLHAAIVAGAPVADREALAAKIGANETALLMMRSNCADNWRKLLTPDQFAQLLVLAEPK